MESCAGPTLKEIRRWGGLEADKAAKASHIDAGWRQNSDNGIQRLEDHIPSWKGGEDARLLGPEDLEVDGQRGDNREQPGQPGAGRRKVDRVHNRPRTGPPLPASPAGNVLPVPEQEGRREVGRGEETGTWGGDGEAGWRRLERVQEFQRQVILWFKSNQSDLGEEQDTTLNCKTFRLFYYNREEDRASWKPPRGIKNGQAVAKVNVKRGEADETMAPPQGYTEHQDLISGASYFVVSLDRFEMKCSHFTNGN